MNKFHFFLACAGLCIAIMATISNDMQSFLPGTVLVSSVLINAIKTKKSAIITYVMTAIVCIFLLNITRTNIVHFGHMTNEGLIFILSAVLTFLFGCLPLWLRNHEYEKNGMRFQ